MKKSRTDHFGINRLIDVRTITEEGVSLNLTATEAERMALAERFDLDAVLSLTVSGRLFWDDVVVFEGVMRSEQKRVCVVSLTPFIEKTEEPIRFLFSEESMSDSSEINMDEDIVLPIIRGKINLGDAISEEFGVNLNPFPRKTQDPFEYRDEADFGEEKDNPFSVLKHLTRKK